MTRHVHACVWGMQGAAPLLDWLGVQRRHRYARASVLDSGESDLDGLILLDLPDHDSVVTASMAAVDRLSKLADMVIWVLDPQKYADAAVHNRYLIPLAGHAAVFTVVLNQIDTLPPAAGQGLRGGPAPAARRRGPARHAGAPGLGADRRRAWRAAPAAHRDGAQEPRGHRPDRGRHRRADRRVRRVHGPAGGAGHGCSPRRPLAPLAAPLPEDGRRPAAGTVPAAVGTRRRTSRLRRSRARAVPAAVGGRDAGRRQARGRRPGRQRADGAGGPARRGVRAAPPACPRWRRPWRAPARRRRRGSPAGRAGWLLGGRRDPMRALRAGRRRQGGTRAAEAAAGQAQQSEVDNAITAFADAVGSDLPEPWAGEPARGGPVATRAWCRRRWPTRCTRRPSPAAVTPAGLVAAGHGLAVAAGRARRRRRRRCRW